MNTPSPGGTESPSRVFISHSAADKAVAEHLYSALEESGIRCWMAPRDISPGKSWASSIIEAITRCEVMVLVYSTHSNDSPQVLREVERALQRKLQLITYRIDDTPPCDDLEYFLSTVQWLDAYTTDSDAHIDYLVESVHHILEPDADLPKHPGAASKQTVVPPKDLPVAGKTTRSSTKPLVVFTLFLIIAVTIWVVASRQAPQPELPLQPVYQTETSRNMAVLPFQNLSQTGSLEWLRSGLTEMIITDLSQSQAFHVLSSQQLHHAIADDNGEIAQAGSIDALQQVGRKADVSSVLSGSFAQIGDTLEISIKIQDSVSGEILLAERSSGPEESVFAIIDDLTSMVRDYFGKASDDALDQDLRDVTTNSLEAYRFYVQGLEFDLQLKREEAIPLLEKAVEIDPEFAMAHARLGWIFQNLGLAGKSAASLEAAFINVDRLPGRERYLVEGLHYSQRWETYHLAVDAFRNALTVDPSLNSARHQLATLYGKLEMFMEAIELWESLRANNYEYPGIENGLAIMYSAQGDFDKGEVLLQSLVQRNPQSSLTHVALGWHYTSWGRLETALDSLETALELQPSGSPFLSQANWRARLLERNYAAAREITGRMMLATNPYSNWLGYKNRAVVSLFAGQSREALSSLEAAGSTYPSPNAFTAMTWLRAAEIHLLTGETGEAILKASQAVEQGQGEWPEWEARFLMASTEYMLGNHGLAEQLAREILQQAEIEPGDILKRMHRQLMGRFAMARGEFALAISELTLAVESLSPLGVAYHFQREPDHVSVWYDLARAYSQDEQPDLAAVWFRKIVDSRIERTIHPILYVRSYYQLGLVLDESGKAPEARTYFEKFLGYWQEGNLDPTAISDARSRLKQ